MLPLSPRGGRQPRHGRRTRRPTQDGALRPETDDSGRWCRRPLFPRAKIVPAGRGADAESKGGEQPRLSLLPRGLSQGCPMALGTQIERCGPALQPPQGTVRLHPVHRAHARAIAHYDVGSLIDRRCACAAWEVIERKAGSFLAGQLTGVCGKRALDSSFLSSSSPSSTGIQVVIIVRMPYAHDD